VAVLVACRLLGMVGFTLAAGYRMGALGEKLTGRDVAIGVILTLSLGLRPAVPALLHRLRQSGRPRCCSATYWGGHETLVVLMCSRWSVSARSQSSCDRCCSLHWQPELAVEAKGVSLALCPFLFLAITSLGRGCIDADCRVLLVFALMVDRRQPRKTVTTRLSTGVLLAAVSRSHKRGSG